MPPKQPNSQKSPKISVIMPAYNVAALLPRAVESLQHQTFTDWHLHIIEDCATDNTLQVAQALALTDTRITVHPQKVNAGPAAARNVGFEAAKGEWVALLDADDAYHPTRLEVLLRVAETNNLDLVSDNLDIYDLAAHKSVGIAWRNLTRHAPELLTLPEFLARTNPHNRFTYGLLKPMFRRSFLQEHKLRYDLRYRVGEDTLLHIHALRVGGKEMVVGTPLYIYTLPRSVSSKDRSPFSHSSVTNTATHIRQATQELLDSSLPGITEPVKAGLRKRKKAYAQWEQSRRFLSALGKRNLPSATKTLLKNPGVLPLMFQLTLRRIRFRLLAKLGLPIAGLLLGLTPSLHAQAITPLAPGDFALHMHPHWPNAKPEDIANVAKFGVRLVRFDLSWKDVENPKGVYDWTKYDKLFAELKANNIRPMAILAKSNPLYAPKDNPGFTPGTEEARTGYANFAVAAVQRYASYNTIFELWNEPDNERFWRPKPSSEDYISMATQACNAIRQVNPSATLIGPGLSTVPNKANKFLAAGFIQDVLAAPQLTSCLSAISVHPYRRIAPETYLNDVNYLKNVFLDVQPAGKMPPIVITEWGYTTYNPPMILTREQQAAYVVRQQLVPFMVNQPFAVLYNWRDDGKNPKEMEHNFGLITADGNPKPVYKALATMRSQLLGSKYVRREKTEAHSPLFVLTFAKPKSTMQVIWSSGKPQTFIRKIPAKTKVSAVDMNGNAIKPGQTSNSLIIHATSEPIYLTTTP